MHFINPAVVVIAAVTALASPAPRYELHEKRNAHPTWTRRYALDGHHVLPIRIALKQQNLEHAEKYIMDVSHPESDNFGKHWSPEQVMKTFRPRYDRMSFLACSDLSSFLNSMPSSSSQ